MPLGMGLFSQGRGKERRISRLGLWDPWAFQSPVTGPDVTQRGGGGNGDRGEMGLVPLQNRDTELRGLLAKLPLLLFVYISLVITQVTETPG